MRTCLTVCILSLTFLHVLATKLYAQRVSLHKVNAPLRLVIDEIRNQTGYDFFMNMESLKRAKPVNISVQDASIEEVLEKCFENQSLTYEIKDNRTVIIKQKEKSLAERVMAYLSPISEPKQQQIALQKQIILRGIVVDSLGNRLQGVIVSIKESKGTTSTDAKGQFAISIQSDRITLIFSHLGMTKQEVHVTDPTVQLQIVMKASEVALDDVVITGYSNIRKESFTGNAIQIDREQLLQVANRNVIDILQVYDPSFRLERNNLMGSDPNTLPEFYIRGRSGIGVRELDQPELTEAALTNNPNLPVFIMDGYEVTAERVYDFDPMQIKSVTILKDAAATAIYGSRAANGVIVIETIPPEPGKIRFNYNLVTSVTAPDLSSYNLMNAAEKLETERLAGHFDAEPNTSAAMNALREYMEKQNQVLRGVNTDWLAMPLQNELNLKHTLSASGGSDQLRFNTTLRYDNQKGVMKGSKRDRLGATMALEYRHGNFQIRNETWYDAVNAVNSPYGNFSTFATKLPYDSPRDENGNILQNTYMWHTGVYSPSLRLNPLYEAEVVSNRSTSNNNTLINNLAVNWQVIPHLTIRGQLSLTKTDSDLEEFIDPLSGRYTVDINTNYDELGSLTVGNSSQTQVNTNFLANYFNFIGDHQVNFSLGLNTQETNQTVDRANYRGFASAAQSSPNFANQIVGQPAYNENKTRLFGTFAALNYSYKDIYLLDLSGRIDGSSEFGTERKWAPFWSAGTGINLHNYAFMKEQTLITRARLSAVVGQLGKTNFQPYAAQHTYRNLSSWYVTGAGTELISMGNEQLQWEITNTTDFILDLGMLQDRLSLNVNWYNKLTNNLVNDVDLPLSTGFTTYKDNIGKVRNRGIELRLRADVIKTKDVMISPWINFAANRNVLLELSNALQRYNDLVNAQYNGYSAYGSVASYRDQYATPHIKYAEGTSITSVYGMRSLGINPTDGKEIFVRPDGTITYDWNASDQVIIGDTSPKGQGALGLNVNYKNFSLMVSLLYQYGGQEYNSTLVSKVENVNLRDHNADRRVLTSRWQQPGDIAQFKDIAESAYTTRPTSRFMQDLNELSINSLSLGYTFKQERIRRWGLNMLRIQGNMNNLGVISSIEQERGTSYPFARTFDLALNVGF